jgi:alpha-galactosidase
MTAETHSFKPIGDYLHAKGLKFGLHLMRGIPRQAVDRDKRADSRHALSRRRHRRQSHVCGWNGDMYGVDMSKPGAQEYYDSVFALMASWGSGFREGGRPFPPYHKAEIEGDPQGD